MFTLRWTDQAATEYARLKAKADRTLQKPAPDGAACEKSRNRRKAGQDEGRFKQVHKCLSLLAENPRHPGLNCHEFRSLEHPFDPKSKVFEAYARNCTPGAYRVFWCYGPGTRDITVIAITPHP